MIKRISFVWKRKDISTEQFKSLWLGEHARIATALEGLQEYVIDFVAEPSPGMPNGIAVTRFPTKEVLDAAFSDPNLSSQLLETRNFFAERVEVFLVEEHVVFSSRETRDRK